MIYLFTTLLGLSVGSFLNVLIYRVPKGLSIVSPPSHCVSCNRKIRCYHNIPVLSYLFLKGKCKDCGAKISLRYPAVEISNALLWLLCAGVFWEKSVVYSLSAMAACSALICIFAIDIDCKLIFYRFQAAFFLFSAVPLLTMEKEKIIEHLIGLAAAAIVFSLLYFAFLLITKREGIGLGDVFLMATSGLLVGWRGLVLVMFLSSVIAAVTLLIVKRVQKIKDRFYEFPFAPFIVIGDLVALFFAEQIIQSYMRLIIGG